MPSVAEERAEEARRSSGGAGSIGLESKKRMFATVGDREEHKHQKRRRTADLVKEQ